jgi:predicted RNA methylase
MKDNLDKYYTKEEVAKYCISLVGDRSCYHLTVEPSAGSGRFSNLIEGCIAYDIEPENDRIIKKNFFDVTYSNKKSILVIGNPPFGKRAKIAIAFFNHASQWATTIAFIVPVQFRKWSVQKHLNKRFHLIVDNDLPKDSFEYEGKTVDVGCSFQIWTIKEVEYDLRLQGTPPVSHPDYTMWLYNNTPEALKYFNRSEYTWDFAVPRQGYYDYSYRVTNQDELNPKVQWMFFKAHSKSILDRLLSIDFEKLSKLNTRIPGYGKADVVKEYTNSK